MIVAIIIIAILFLIFIKYILPWLLLFLFGKWLIKNKDRVDIPSIIIGAIIGFLFARLWKRIIERENSHV